MSGWVQSMFVEEGKKLYEPSRNAMEMQLTKNVRTFRDMIGIYFAI